MSVLCLKFVALSWSGKKKINRGVTVHRKQGSKIGLFDVFPLTYTRGSNANKPFLSYPSFGREPKLFLNNWFKDADRYFSCTWLWPHNVIIMQILIYIWTVFGIENK